MRRQFRRDILITTPPPKPKPKQRSKKNPEKKSLKLRILFSDWIREAGEAYSVEDLASSADVHVKTAKKYLQGFPPAEERIGLVALYFANLMHYSHGYLWRQIRDTLDDWRMGEESNL